MRILFALSIALFSGSVMPLRAQDQNPPEPFREDFTFLGWKSGACAAAFQIFRELPSSLGAEGTPAWARIGTLQWPPERKDAALEWTFTFDGDSTWNGREADTAVESLARAGYSQPGYAESVRPDFKFIFSSTESFRPAGDMAAAPEGFVLWKVFYSPDDACALLVRHADISQDAYRTALVRGSKEARRARSRAHVSEALFLYKNGNLDDGQAEAAVAAGMDPDYAPARYQNAALLSAQGRFDEALPELKAAMQLHPAYADQARSSDEFEAYRNDPRFQDVVNAKEP